MLEDKVSALQLFDRLTERQAELLIEAFFESGQSLLPNADSLLLYQPERGDNRHLPNNGVMSHGDGLN